MKAIPIRIRVTLLVLGAALLTGLFVVLAGGVDSVEDTLVGEPFESFDSDIEGITGADFESSFDQVVVVVTVVLLFGLAGLTWFALGRALSPVVAIADQVDRIGAENLNQRVPVPAADDELRRLAETMNLMLDRLEQSDVAQRRFVSDASHELRSPITAIRATLEVASANPSTADWDQTAQVLQEENDRLASLVDDLLLLARMDEQPPWVGFGGQVDLEEICLAEAERPRAVPVAVRVDAPARVNGDGRMLTRAIRNLVDNAAAHAKTQVWIEIGQRSNHALVRVRDDGPGVPAHMADQIFERFVRVDESRVRGGSGGAGLGLAIARGITDRHGGYLTLLQGSRPGATFELELPMSYPQ